MVTLVAGLRGLFCHGFCDVRKAAEQVGYETICPARSGLELNKAEENAMHRHLVPGLAAFALAAVAAGDALAQDAVKVGLILPMTGQQTSTGKQIDAAVRLYMQQNGSTVAGKKIEVILKDDAAVPDTTKRLAQELIVNDKVSFIAGFGVTPAALAAAPLATQAKIPEVVMAAGTSIITERSPYIVRTSFTLPQSSVIIADWAAKNGIKKVVTIVS